MQIKIKEKHEFTKMYLDTSIKNFTSNEFIDTSIDNETFFMDIDNIACLISKSIPDNINLSQQLVQTVEVKDLTCDYEVCCE